MENVENNIFAEIKEIKYKSFLDCDLKEITLSKFNINTCPSYCVINTTKGKICFIKMGLSKAHSLLSFRAGL